LQRRQARNLCKKQSPIIIQPRGGGIIGPSILAGPGHEAEMRLLPEFGTIKQTQNDKKKLKNEN
jgi:hypothetical protein